MSSYVPHRTAPPSPLRRRAAAAAPPPNPSRAPAHRRSHTPAPCRSARSQQQHRLVQPLLPQLRLVQLRRRGRRLHEQLVHGLHPPVREPREPRHARRPQGLRENPCAGTQSRTTPPPRARTPRSGRAAAPANLPRVRERPLRQRIRRPGLRHLRPAPRASSSAPASPSLPITCPTTCSASNGPSPGTCASTCAASIA